MRTRTATPRRHRVRGRWPALAIGAGALCCTLSGAAQAQLRLPPAPGLPALPGLTQRQPLTPPSLPEPLPAGVPLHELRLTTVRELLRRHPDTLEADPAGEPVRRREVVLASPSAAALDAARALGLTLLREQTLPELELHQVVLRVPSGLSSADALARLRAADPQLQADFNHLYTRSGDAATAAAPATPSPAMATAAARRVGLIDSGVDARHGALRAAQMHTWGCNGRALPSPHGTAVASLLVGRDRAFSGALPAATLYAADVYCDQPAGGAAEDIAQALAWLARERVAVINISLVGPANRLLEQAVRAMQRKGHLIVAAVGNDGPAAPPLYPASYAGVVGVTGVNAARQVLPEAARGAQVLLAAPGADLAAARLGGGYVAARGTSYAAPLVAGLLADVLHAPEPDAASAAVARVGAGAQDLGAPGRDPVFGLGLVGESVRTAPERVQARLR